jgi:hypothetical protein
MDEKITIIEGPPPAFEDVHEGWPLGLSESPTLHKLAMTRLRTFNGPSLVERCFRTWRKRQTIQLEFRAADGLIHKTPIIASRAMEVEDGQMILLWVRFTEQEALLELGSDDDQADNEEDDQDLPF